MLNIRLINNYVMTEFLLADKELILMSVCDDGLKQLDLGLGFTSPTNTILGIYKEQELICCILLSFFTNTTYEWHIYLGTKWHHTGMSKQVKETFYKYLKDNTDCKCLVTLAPIVCVHVHKALLNSGYKLTGTVPNGITWRGQLQDLNIYSEELR